jgi:uncharacterized protein (TIGR00290 family)
LDLLLSWSGGKDSALALRALTRSRRYRVRALLTTLTEGYDRVSMHGVRRQLLHAQAGSLGLPLEEVWIPRDSSNLIYDERMRAALEKYVELGVKGVASGDLFLADVRAYRETRLREVGMKGVFPLWQRKTDVLARQFLDLGFSAVTCCVDSKKLPRDFCGVPYDREFLARLPQGVDPCGENGEFHTFVFDGPLFGRRIGMKRGRVVSRQGFYFAELVPVGQPSAP